MWDTIGACDIKGASDASIRNAVPNDVAALIQKLGVRAVFCNGAASGRIYAKYAEPLTHLPAAVLPSTSPANAAWSPRGCRRHGALPWHHFCARMVASERILFYNEFVPDSRRGGFYIRPQAARHGTGGYGIRPYGMMIREVPA